MDTTQFESLDQMAETTAAGLSPGCSKRLIPALQGQTLSEVGRFDRLSQTEQDRIFNELVVANLFSSCSSSMRLISRLPMRTATI